MSGPNPQVSVFHFTSRISSAKIRKYKMATERGMLGSMTSYQTVQDTRLLPTHPEKIQPPTTVGCPSTESPRPLKKPRLILKAPRPLAPADNVAPGSRPGQAPTVQSQYSQDMTFGNDGVVDPKAQLTSKTPLKVKTSKNVAPPAIHGQSSLPSDVSRSDPVREGYGDLMSYYIAKGDSDNPALAKPGPRSVAKSRPKLKLKKQTPAHPPSKGQGFPRGEQPRDALKVSPASEQANSIVSQPMSNGSSSSSTLPTHIGRHAPAQRMPANPHLAGLLPQSAPSASLPQLAFEWIDIVFDPKPSQEITIAEMVTKVERLSTALANFGGVPTMPNISTTTQTRSGESHAAESETSVTDGRECNDVKQDSDIYLDHVGAPDVSLNHGIIFIMNALKSWAQQRLTAETLHKMEAEAQKRASSVQARDSRLNPDGRGMSTDETITVSCNLADTPEGVAIKAFQDVLECGCLQMNVILPIQLSRALGQLYMQIDQLINNGQNEQAKWKCMSYGTQILAHQGRLNRWKEERRTIQAEMLQQLQNAEFLKLARASLDSTRALPVNPSTIRSGERHGEPIDWQHVSGFQGAAHCQPEREASDIRSLKPLPVNPLAFSSRPCEPSHALQTDDTVNARSLQVITDRQRDANAPVSYAKHDWRTGYLPLSGQSMIFSFSPATDTRSIDADEQVGSYSQSRSQGPKGLRSKSLTRQSGLTQPQSGDSTERPLEIHSSDPSSPKPPRDAANSTPRLRHSKIEKPSSVLPPKSSDEGKSLTQLGDGPQVSFAPKISAGSTASTKERGGTPKPELTSTLPSPPSDVSVDQMSSSPQPENFMAKGPSPSASSSQGSTIAVALARPPSPVRSIKLRPSRRTSRKSGPQLS